MIYETLGISAQSAILLVATSMFLYWLVRYAGGMRREVRDNRAKLEEDMRDLEEVARKLETDLDGIYKRIDSKVDQTQLELKLEELERKRAELIQSAIEAKRETKKKAQVSVEFLAIFTLLLLPIVAGFIYAYSSISDSSKFKADVALDRIGAVAEQLYVEGPGASAMVFVDFPSGIDYSSSYIGTKPSGEGHYLSLNVSGSETFRFLDACVSGTWPNTMGGKVRPGFTALNLTVSSSGCVAIVQR